MAVRPSPTSQRLAGPLTRPPAAGPGARALLAATVLAALLHALLLAAFSLLLRPPSLLKNVAPPFYTRTITPEAPAVAAPVPAAAAVSRPIRPVARIHKAQAAPKRKANAPRPSTDHAPWPEAAASAATPEPATTADGPAPAEWAQAASAPVAAASADAPPAPPETNTAAMPPASAPAPAASAATPAFVAQWPANTRLRYRLGGNYRGELYGEARVLWQREGTQYQTSVQLDVGILLSMRLTSQGEITAAGLRPRVYEEQVRQRRRGVRLDDDVRLHSGERVPRPDTVQDTASQFVELSHRLASGQIQPEAGTQINFWLARPGGVDEWTYDVIGEETLYLPRFGAVQAIHLKPRSLAKPRGSIVAEIWYAPRLQYLPVRIRITQNADTYIDLMVETIEQQ